MKICQWQTGKLKVTLSEESCSAKFWLLYIYYLHVLKRFIIAERTSNWSLHIPGHIGISSPQEYTFKKCKVLLKSTFGYIKSLLQVSCVQIVVGMACGAISSLNKRWYAPLKHMVVSQKDEVFLKVPDTCRPSVSATRHHYIAQCEIKGHVCKDKQSFRRCHWTKSETRINWL